MSHNKTKALVSSTVHKLLLWQVEPTWSSNHLSLRKNAFILLLNYNLHVVGT